MFCWNVQCQHSFWQLGCLKKWALNLEGSLDPLKYTQGNQTAMCQKGSTFKFVNCTIRIEHSVDIILHPFIPVINPSIKYAFCPLAVSLTTSSTLLPLTELHRWMPLYCWDNNVKCWKVLERKKKILVNATQRRMVQCSCNLVCFVAVSCRGA